MFIDQANSVLIINRTNQLLMCAMAIAIMGNNGIRRIWYQDRPIVDQHRNHSYQNKYSEYASIENITKKLYCSFTFIDIVTIYQHEIA